MVAVKAHQADAFLKAVERLPALILLYGSDAGLVSERSAQVARSIAARDDPPGEVLRMDDASLEEDPDRLIVELNTVPMFGGRKVVRATTGRRINAQSLKPLIEGPDIAGVLIVEAGNLRPDEALRALFEKAAKAAAIACYPDEARDLDALMREVLGSAGVEISPEARRLLQMRLGADRALSRGEIEKLALYARDKGRIEEDDIEACVGDAAELALDRVVMATASGRVREALRELDRCEAGGESAQGAIAALQRHFLRLHRVRVQLEAGKSMDEALRQMRPPPHFKQKPEIEAQLRAWSLAKLAAALARIAETAKAARLSSSLEGALAGALLVDIGRLAGPAGKG
ncbi:MAG: DNA polymerase III subunit delta [Hyphomicrobiaceae bacterium]|nr:DNA polymerase III subunit delta [Hyphomicrobiaceae bacterium]